MKRFFICSAMAIAIVSACSCKKSSSSPSPAYHITFLAGGVNKDFNISATAQKGTDGSIEVTGQIDSANSVPFDLFINSRGGLPIVPGTYTDTSTTFAIAAGYGIYTAG